MRNTAGCLHNCACSTFIGPDMSTFAVSYRHSSNRQLQLQRRALFLHSLHEGPHILADKW
jgi:hypothetical protein